MKIFDYYKRCNGSISLFLAMIILLVISLVLTSLEGVRIKSSYARCNEITYVAVDSCFSKYGREIFEDYGLMMLWQDEDAFISEYEGYVDKNCNYKKDILYNSVDLLSLRQENAELVNKTMATDEDGELIENQICEYMKAALTEDLINQILANNQALSQNDGINVFNEKLEECGDYINEAEASVEKIYDNIDVVKAGYNPSELIENMKLKLEEIKELPPESDNAVRNSLYIQYRAELKKYQQWEGEVNEALLQVLNSTNDYLVNTTSAINEVNNLKSSINAEKDNYQKYIFDTMEEELEDINNNILSLENDNYNVSNNKQYTIEQKKNCKLGEGGYGIQYCKGIGYRIR